MARKEKMVTRTFVETHCNAVFYNVEKNEMLNLEVTIPGIYKSNEEVTKFLRARDTSVLKLAFVKDTYEVETLRGMTEETFLLNSVILPPRSKAEPDEE